MTTATKERKAARKSQPDGHGVSVADLRRALAAAGAAVQARGAKPVLANVLLSSETLTGTDLEMRITAPLDCYTGPAMLLPHQRLSAIVAELDAGDVVTLTPDGSSCIVTAGRVTYRLPTEDVNEFPAVSDSLGNAKPIARLPGDQFVSLMNAVRFATDNESSRYALGGVRVEFAKGMLSLVGTDGRRMAVAEVEIDQATDDAAVTVPRRAVDTLCRLAKNADVVQLSASATELVAEVDGTLVRARLVEGKFPRWHDVEPDRTVQPSLLVVDTLLHACRQAAICTSEQSKGVTFTFTEDGLHLTSRSSEAGEASVTCDVVEPGHACSVSLDPAFVLQWLGCGSFDASETIEVEAEDKTTAVVLRAQDCRCIIMPLAAE